MSPFALLENPRNGSLDKALHTCRCWHDVLTHLCIVGVFAADMDKYGGYPKDAAKDECDNKYIGDYLFSFLFIIVRFREFLKCSVACNSYIEC